MTRDEARQAAAVMNAYADGKTIQIFKDGEWVDHDDPRFVLGPENYRVKPPHPHEGNDPVLVCTSCGNVALAGTVFIKPFEAWPSGPPPLTQFKPSMCQDCQAQEAQYNR